MARKKPMKTVPTQFELMRIQTRRHTPAKSSTRVGTNDPVIHRC